MTIGQDAAELLALEALGWLAGTEDLLGVFLGATGATEEDVRARAGEPEFLGAVLDFLLMDDAWVTAAAEACRVAPERFVEARAALPGGGAVHWT